MGNTRVHFIAIGGAVMHNLALALHHKGYQVTGSDDEIFEPSKTRLSAYNLLPKEMGWFPEKITTDLEAVILGMHARNDNPELLKAKELGIKIYSFPEYIYEQSKNKQRIVIGGSHGKTTITAMIMHVLKTYNRKFDYLVGAKLEGFDTMVQITEDAPIIIIEGDEYLTSPLDLTPKFLHYHHHIGLISGVAWDHINVYPTFEEYVHQFDAFADSTPKGGILIYSESDDIATLIAGKPRTDVQAIPYSAEKNEIIKGITYLLTDKGKVPLEVFGKHNLKNISAAKNVCIKIGITEKMFYDAIKTFKGAANRLEILGRTDTNVVFKDFAHAPSKLKATSKAVKKQFPDRNLVAVLELHTFSSLNKEFLSQYRDTYKLPDTPVVYFSPETVKHKRLEEITEADIMEAFANPKLNVFTDSKKLEEFLFEQNWKNSNLLLMSSGNFGGIDLKQLTSHVLNQHA
ncbi:Mur ligase family protein [uncultured Cytophaga sp.]|uniref:UDP-N-acetylmuramate--L-alanine ligase n=1 Tax=uncultured Cytophaga sp. TaxID=160238 RepID=UPI0026307F5A|nr:Mur ligase family protein [uncultured Cytophaga sp.]